MISKIIRYQTTNVLHLQYTSNSIRLSILMYVIVTNIRCKMINSHKI